MIDLSRVEETLTRLGFTEHPDHPAANPSRIAALSENGPYVVHGTWQKGDTIAHVEENVAPETFEDPDGNVFTAEQYHFPPVIVVENTVTGGRVAISFHDLEAFESIVSGNTDFTA